MINLIDCWYEELLWTWMWVDLEEDPLGDPIICWQCYVTVMKVGAR